ncbi:Ankyrin repeat protein [Rickettsiales bacterium Ac37b]|nr:Ankyrin repeat protein [Rickettsiales bacterium Ac37b]
MFEQLKFWILNFFVLDIQHKEIVYNLIENNKGVINVQDEEGNTLLHYSVFDEKLIKKLLECKADPYIINKNGVTVLHNLIAFSDVFSTEFNEIFNNIIENNKGILNLQDEEGNTLLHYAISNEIVVKRLLECGANPNIINKKGRTPFILSVRGLYTTVAKILFEHGADTYISDNNGENGLLLALREGCIIDSNFHIIEEMMEIGVDLFAENKNGVTAIPLFLNNHMIEEKTLCFIKYLMTLGCDINSTDKVGNTLWHYYANVDVGIDESEFHVQESFSQFLLTHIDINKQNNYNYSPLVSSIMNGNLERTFFIIACGAKIAYGELMGYVENFTEEEYRGFLIKVIKIGKIADRIYNQQIIEINDESLFRNSTDANTDIALKDHKLLQLRLKSLCWKNGMPINLDQHINKYVTFGSNMQPYCTEMKKELVDFVKSLVKTKEEMGMIIESVLAALLHSYNPKKFPLAPYSVLKNMTGQMQNVGSYRIYDQEYPEFKYENSIDYLFDSRNRNEIYPILLANDDHRQELLTALKRFIFFKNDHKLFQKLMADCKMFDENVVKLLYNKVVTLENQLHTEKNANNKRSREKEILSYADQVLEKKSKTTNTQEGAMC